MVQYPQLDRTFTALADPTRRAILERLGQGTGGVTMTGLAEPFGMSEVTAPERIVQTFEAEHVPGQVHTETTTFEDIGDQTRLTITLVFDSTDERDRILNSGAERGMNQTYARLDGLLARLAA